MIVGSRDRFVPLEFMQRLSRERLGIEPAVLDVGHLVPLARPVELVREINAAIAIHITAGSA